MNHAGSFGKSAFDIAIVGGGVVGTTLASLLGRSGYQPSVVVVDAGKPVVLDLKQYDPRVVALSRGTESILIKAGVWEGILGRRACPYYQMYVWDGEGTGNIHFDCADIYEQNLGHIVENSVLLASLYDRLNSIANIEYVNNVKVEEFKHRDAISTIQLDNGQELSASLVVAADGAHSSLRELAGFTVREWDYGHSAIVTTVETEKPHQFTAWQRFSTDGPLAFLPLSDTCGENRQCSIVWSIRHLLADQMMGLNDTDFCEALTAALECKLGHVVHADKRFKFPLKQRHSKRYVAPGLVLVGDAAHTVHPLAGQGANLGMYDVNVLAEEIERALLRGLPLSDISVIKRYERRRQAHNLLAMSTMEGFKRLFGAEDLTWRWLRNQGLRIVDETPWVKNQFSKFASGQF